MIDSAWFYQKLEKDNRSLRGMARALGLDPSAVSRMLRGERKMTADEQDGIASYLDIPLSEVASRRRGEVSGLAERGQEPLIMDGEAASQKPADSEGRLADNWLDRVRGCMKGTITIAPGVDLTEPADPEWAKIYDED